VKVKYLAPFAALIILALAAGSVFAQEGEMQVVDEVIAQVNDDVITLSMLKRETKERIDALKQSGMTEQQATEEVAKHQAELIATLINEKRMRSKRKLTGASCRSRRSRASTRSKNFTKRCARAS
jgi:microcompartment protein CcmL/EutN